MRGPCSALQGWASILPVLHVCGLCGLCGLCGPAGGQDEGLSAQFSMMYACVAVLLGLLHMRESQRSFTEVAMEALRSFGRVKCCTRAGHPSRD